MTVARQHFQCETTAPQRARSWLQSALAAALPRAAESTQLIYDAQLCASELLTNTVDAGCAAATLCIRLTADRLRLSVIDDADGTPEVAPFDPCGPGGRGLLLVSTIAERWGVDPAASGKEVWVELRRSC